MEEHHLSLSEAAAALEISERTAYRWIKSGKLRAYKPGRDYWIPYSAVRELVQESEVRPKAPGRSPYEPSFNDVLEDLRHTTRRYENYHAVQKALDEYREVWETKLETGDLDKAAFEEAGRALDAFWPAVLTAAEAEIADLERFGDSREKAVVLPAMARFQALGERVNSTYREKFREPRIYPFPQREAS